MTHKENEFNQTIAKAGAVGQGTYTAKVPNTLRPPSHEKRVRVEDRLLTMGKLANDRRTEMMRIKNQNEFCFNQEKPKISKNSLMIASRMYN